MTHETVETDVFFMDKNLLYVEMEWCRKKLKPLKVEISDAKYVEIMIEFFKMKAEKLGRYAVNGDTVVFEYIDLDKVSR